MCKKGTYKIVLMAILLTGACFLTYYCHVVLEVGPVFTHLFYIPIFLASFWWRRKGLIVAVFLGALLILSHNFLRVEVATINDYLRACMFLVIGMLIATVSEQIAKAEKKLLDIHQQLRSLVSRLTLAEEHERKKVAALLHDDALQKLSIIKMKLGVLRKSAKSPDLSDSLDSVYESMGQVIKSTRSLTFDLCSPILYDLGLEAAIRDRLKREVLDKHGIAVDFEDDGCAGNLGEDLRTALYRAVQELIMNVIKHSKAQKVKVSLRNENNKIEIDVEDDGIGFTAAKSNNTDDTSGGLGLFTIRDRLGHFGGTLKIKTAPDEGTRVSITLPLNN